MYIEYKLIGKELQRDTYYTYMIAIIKPPKHLHTTAKKARE